MIEVVILAGGNSLRFGSNKLLTVLNGKPIFRHTMERLVENSDFNVTVVTQYEQIVEYCRSKSIDCVFSEECKRGLSFSIGAALNKILSDDRSEKINEIVFLAADQPYITPDIIKKLYFDYMMSGKGLGSCFCNGRPSNPTIFSAKYFDALKQLSGDDGGRKIIIHNSDDCCYSYVNEWNILRDIDRPEQLYIPE